MGILVMASASYVVQTATPKIPLIRQGKTSPFGIRSTSARPRDKAKTVMITLDNDARNRARMKGDILWAELTLTGTPPDPQSAPETRRARTENK